MTRISFYVLGDTSSATAEGQTDNPRWLFACRLAEKAWRSGNKIFVALNSPEEAEAFDELLWRYRPESFVPHNCEHSDAPTTDIVVGCADDCGDHHDLLINLRKEVPIHFSRFERLAEVVSQDSHVLTETREHFGFYRERGYPIETHKI